MWGLLKICNSGTGASSRGGLIQGGPAQFEDSRYTQAFYYLNIHTHKHRFYKWDFPFSLSSLFLNLSIMCAPNEQCNECFHRNNDSHWYQLRPYTENPILKIMFNPERYLLSLKENPGTSGNRLIFRKY